MSEAELCDEMIEFEVCNSRTLRSDMKIGTFKMDINYIYSQSKHSINRKWLLLSDDDDRMAGAKGYLKVSVNILGPGDEAPVRFVRDLIGRILFFFIVTRKCW
jgi:dysferlin